jgi:hypothetical protein
LNVLHGLATYIAAEGLAEYRPTSEAGTLYLNRVPAQPDNLLALFATGGVAATDSFSGGLDNPTVQLRIRDRDNQQAMARAWQLYHSLHRLAGVMLAGDLFLVECVAIQPPAFLARDENRRTEYVFNVRLMIRAPRPTYA